jgi:hypothetical protein
MLGRIAALPAELGQAETLRADTGYLSEGNLRACEAAGIWPLIAMGRQPHHPPLAERVADTPPAPENPTPVEAMAHRLKTPEGRKLDALRKPTPEPVFGMITSVLGFRQVPLRGLDKVRGERSLVTMAWNITRLFALSPARTGQGRGAYSQNSGHKPKWGLAVRAGRQQVPDESSSAAKCSRHPDAAVRRRNCTCLETPAVRFL